MDKRIQDLPPASTIEDVDLLHISQLDIDKKLTFSQLQSTVLSEVEDLVEDIEGILEQVEDIAIIVEANKVIAVDAADLASDSATAAEISEDNSKDSELNAQDSALMAKLWASKPENEIVEDSYYSAFHYMKKAILAQEGAELAAEEAEGSAEDADAAAIRAEDASFTVTQIVDAVTPNVYRFKGNGVVTVFTLPVDPVSINNTQLFIGGEYVNKDTYNLIGKDLVIVPAPPASAVFNIEVVVGPSVQISTVDSKYVKYKSSNVESVLDDLTANGATYNYVDELLFTHNHDENAHPELTVIITDAAERAETAADAAFVNANVYPDVATGRAAVADGEQFQVVSGNEIIRYRRDSSTTQTEVARYPNGTVFNTLVDKVNDLDLYVEDIEPLIEILEDSRDGTADLEISVDVNGDVYRKVDPEGHVYVNHIDESVQDSINRRSSGLSPANPGDDIVQIWDNQDNLVQRIDTRGAMYLVGNGGHVQHHMRQPLGEKTARFQQPLKLQRDKYQENTAEMVGELQKQCLPFVEPPPLLVPNGYDVPVSVMEDIVLADDNPVVQLPFPNTDGGSVHPYILPMRVPFLGYKYLLLDSCHKNGTNAEETPVMFGTNDLINFDLIPDVPNPMTHSAPGGATKAYGSFNSDPFFAYDPTDGGLIWGTRESFEVTGNIDFILTKSYDGVNWSPRVRQPKVGGGLSPCMLYDIDGGFWHMWTADEGVLYHHTAPGIYGPWTEQSIRNFQSLYGIKIWHLEVKYLGNKFALVCHSRQVVSQVYIGLSENGDDWFMSQGLVEPQSPNIYKPTFFPEFREENEVRFTFMWSHWNWTDQSATPYNGMQLYIQQSDWINIE